MKKQNEFADLDDNLSTADGMKNFSLTVNFVVFIVLWIVSGSFLVTLFATFLSLVVFDFAVLLVVKSIAEPV
jgi:hypothetical protein